MTVPSSVPFPLSQWLAPELTAVHRLPMTPRRVPYDSVASAREGAPSPWVRSLDGPWKVLRVAHPDAVTARHVDPRTSDARWAELEVPGSWAMPGGPFEDRPIYTNVKMPWVAEPFDVPDDNPTVVHRRTFSVPRSWRRRRTLLSVGSADSTGFVFVNGAFVGMQTDSRLASTFDVTAHLTPGENLVAIVVCRWSPATWLEDQDQWWLPGLHRSVELVSVPSTAVAAAHLVPGLEADGTTGTIAVTVEVDGDVRAPHSVEVLVETTRGRRRTVARLAPTPVPVFSFRSARSEAISAHLYPGPRVEAVLRAEGIEPWHHDDPVLHRAIVILRDGTGDVVDVRAQRLGFRSVAVRDRQLLVNGKPVVINGVNRHEIHPDRGRSIDEATLELDLALMKQHHVNAVRTAHSPAQERFYDLCDEIGLYVIDEADIETHARWASLANDARVQRAMAERIQRMVLRDLGRTCVIGWSLGNESGVGPVHHAMHAWIHAVDPSRFVQYEGPFFHGLGAPSPMTDVVCPMYAPPEEISRWSAGTDPRPLVLCEYGHAMGQAGGLDAYWRRFGTEPGLQGGFCWEWVDHALRVTEPDGSTWLAYGGDFGEERHDGTFVCDGLVSPDREPHPMLADLAALAAPITLDWDGRRVMLGNRRWFTDTSDLTATYEVLVDATVVERGRLDLPAVAPRSAAPLSLPPSARRPRGHEAFLTISVRSRTHGDVATVQVALPTAPPRAERRAPVSGPIGVGRDELVLGDLAIAWPELCLWRAPTDNDDPPGAWRAGASPADRWRAWGLDALDSSTAVRRVDGGLARTTRWIGSGGETAVHRCVASVDDGAIVLRDEITTPAAWSDLARVGVAVDLPGSLDTARWFGLGPGDSYPDRRAAALVGTWSIAIAEQRLPFVTPQEFGLHLDTRWLELRARRTGVHVEADQRFAWSALHEHEADLAAATHAHLVPRRPEVRLHLDVAHRGLGTLACGPDTAPEHLVRPGRRRVTWRLSMLS